jgi:c-di-GMP-related signal transduction protein
MRKFQKGYYQMDIFVARQPIFRKNKNILGYELLFRDGTTSVFTGIDGDIATSKVLSNSFFSIGIENIAGKNPAFINFTRELLLNQAPAMFPKESLAVEILEDLRPEKDLVDACQELSNKGYTIALDDFFYHSDMKPLIALADIIKFDFRASPIEKIKEDIERLSPYNIKFLAEKVETNEEFQTALDMGFEYFQGYFFSKPETITGKDISSAQMNLLGIMAEANRSDFQFDKVESIINRDVAISYKLMRYINSAYYRRANTVSSIRQAMLLLGEKGIRSFLSLIAMTKLGKNKPDELIRSSIIRAKFCELLGGIKGLGVNSSELFTLGLFSSIDAILDDTMENLMGKLPLSDELKDALIHKEGKLNDYLGLTVSYEKGDWAGVSTFSDHIHADDQVLPQFFMQAISWADAIV